MIETSRFSPTYANAVRMKRIVIVAGPNGAGKTTFAKEYLPREAACPNFINADLIAAGLSPTPSRPFAAPPRRQSNWRALPELPLTSWRMAELWTSPSESARREKPGVNLDAFEGVLRCPHRKLANHRGTEDTETGHKDGRIQKTGAARCIGARERIRWAGTTTRKERHHENQL